MRVAFASFAALVCSLFLVQHTFADFTDTTRHPYEEAIRFVQDEEIVQGYSDGSYRPNAPINRAEFTKIIVMAALPDESGENCFSDVKREWFATFVCTAKEKGLIGGYPDGTFKPAQNINVAEAAKIIAIAFNLELEAGGEWYEPYAKALDKENAVPPSIKQFDQLLTRGEMAAIIFAIEKSGGESEDEEGISTGWKKRLDAAFAKRDCPASKAHRYGNLYYDGQLIDSHFHIPNIPDSMPGDEPDDAERMEPLLGVNLTIPDMICSLEQEKTNKVFAFFPVYPEIHEHMLPVAKRAMEQYPDRFVPFIMPPDHDDDPEGFPTVDATDLKDMLKQYPGLFQGYGEIGLYARGEDGAPALPPDSKRLLEIYPIVRQNKLAVYFHLGEGQKESFEKALEQNPDIPFIFHGDQLIPYEKGKQNLKYIEEIIREHPNVYYTVDELWGDKFMVNENYTKEEYLAHLENYEELLKQDIATWGWIIEKYPNQFMWGTDRSDNVLWNHHPDVGVAQANYGRAFIARLSPAVQEKFAYKNAEALLEKAAK